jgi:hypothetical protein
MAAGRTPDPANDVSGGVLDRSRWPTLLLTIPNQLGVDYNAHLLDSILKYVAPELGWR